MVFYSLQRSLQQRVTNLKKSESVVGKLTEAIRLFVTENYGVPYASLVQCGYDKENTHLVLTVSSKILASELLLQISQLQTIVRILGIPTKRIIIR